MADKRIKDYWSREMDALLETYNQFQTLISSPVHSGAGHVGEDGRYVEYLLKEYLKKYLPRDLEVLTGFILRPAVNCGKNDKSRKKDEHEYSGQLDILIYDTAHYPVYQRFSDNVIVPPEGVIGIISVKKHLRQSDVEHEIDMLNRASWLCPHKLGDNTNARAPFTALITMEDKIDEKAKKPWTAKEKGERVFKKLEAYYLKKKVCFYDEMVDFVGSLSQWGLYKQRNKKEKRTNYMFFEYDSNKSLGFQLILQNIMSVYYGNVSDKMVRPGFTDITAEEYNEKWGPISFDAEEIVRKKIRETVAK